MIRGVKFVPGEYYHIYNRGSGKQQIFFDDRDYTRLMFLILYYQSDLVLHNIGHTVSHFIKHKTFNVYNSRVNNILRNRMVELVNFVQMPNHFHILVREQSKNGIPLYMQRAQGAYAKYCNAKYGKSGHIFQGPYQAVHIQNNEQLLHLSAYIHRNPRELKKWKNKEHLYPWSSFRDYTKENRWNNLLSRKIILDQFSSQAEYKDFVDTSKTKEQLYDDLFID